MSKPSLSRRVLGVVAGASLLVGLVPVTASAATPDPRDPAELACPPDEVPDPNFSDDDQTTDEHEANIACVVWYELAKGKTTTTYGVGEAVNRGQMASFIANLVEAGGVTLPDNPPDAFSDDDDTTHEKRINQLAAIGVVEGDENGRYNHTFPVTRAQMASFLNRAYEEITGAALTSSEDYFTDDEGAFHEDNINAVAEAGIAAGKTATTYDPAGAVLREQMATFLARETDLLVEKDKIDKPVVKEADVKLASTTVKQGDELEGTIDTAEGVTITAAKVSGCGLTDEPLTLTGQDNAFTVRIPVTQPAAQCKLTFTMTLDDESTVTDEETITVQPAGSQTSLPELVSVTSSVSGDTATVTYNFDETLNAAAGADRLRFKLYSAGADPTPATTATVSGSTVKATFTKAAFEAATTAAVAFSAVEDSQNQPNPEGSQPLAAFTNSSGDTAAPDLIGVLTFEDKLNVRSFQFDEGAYDVGSASNYHLVFTDGTSAAGTEFEQTNAADRAGKDFRNVRFGEAHAGKTIVRGWIDTGTVSDAAQDGNPLNGDEGSTNPLEAVHKEGQTDPRPALVSISIDAGANTVTYQFNRGVSVVDSDPIAPGTQSNRFTAYRRDASEVRSSSATASGNTVTATFTGDPDPITIDTIGAGMLSDAVQANIGGQRNFADELSAPQKTSAGRTLAPDLLSVSRSTSGSNTVLTFTFDQPVSTSGQTSQGFPIYQEDGSRRELSFNSTPSSSNTCSADGDKVVCTAATSSADGAAMASAKLAGVEANAVDDPANSAYTNYETTSKVG